MTERKPLRSGELARAAGVSQQTLRYYERRGLLATPPRSLGGHRQYPPHAVTVLRAIKGAQRLGFSLDEVAELLAIRARPRRAGVDLHRSVGVKLAEVESRIADLTIMRDTLREARDAGCADLADCAGNDACPIDFSAGQAKSLRPNG